MPGERTIYRKIQVVLEYVKEGKHSSIDSLVEAIYKRHPTNFAFYKRDKETTEIVKDYSRKSIQQVINLCIAFGLIDRNSLGLTELGVSATDPRSFSNIVGEKTGILLNEKGIPINQIENSIGLIIKNSKPAPPTSLEIWDHLKAEKTEIQVKEFRFLMNLLGQCGILIMTQKRIFLPIT
jgi:hypothetical protein